MRDEQPHIVAECKHCGFRFDVQFGLSCPACRTEAVKKAFAPIDALRTALGMGFPAAFRITAAGYIVPLDGSLSDTLEEVEDAPANCYIPSTEEDQLWQLKRLFRK